jgi:hypothetical protein
MNDSGRAVVLRIDDNLEWLVGLDEFRSLEPGLPRSYGEGGPVKYEILDASSCSVVGTVLVNFADMPDARLVINVDGSTRVVPAESPTGGRKGQGSAQQSPKLCVTHPEPESSESPSAP